MGRHLTLMRIKGRRMASGWLSIVVGYQGFLQGDSMEINILYNII
ncbi:hypothetical protein RLDS_11340 [Sphingobium lactosutens DS20]|uniref:Uncharacterized protein n=1 Tax=Sphingobium lactosutens DS20 TaxID=1331060 RepID=T0HQZ9_9SPHN|nr:hypothetical protein RLDS_11340 [Sphingobium lactosutens DS20]